MDAAVVAIVGAVAAALVSGVFSVRSVRARERAERAASISERQREISEPVFEMFHELLDQKRTGRDFNPEQNTEKVGQFLLWVQVYGSDRSVRATHRWMQSAFNQAPAPVAMRLLMEMLIELRRDLRGSTKVRYVDLLGLRIKDLYNADAFGNHSLPLRSFCKKNDWTPPWPPAMDR